LLVIACRDSTRPASPGIDLNAATPASISLLGGQRSATLGLGARLRLSVTVRNWRGDILPAPPSLSIISRDSSVIRVDSGLVVEAVRMGEARVVGSLPGMTGLIADSLTITVVCTSELNVTIKPIADTLAVGESFTPTASLSTCGNRVEVTDTFRWTAGDTALIRVDSITGRTTGLKPGPTAVFVRGAIHGELGGVFVLVR
jgi:hypothetical protein